MYSLSFVLIGLTASLFDAGVSTLMKDDYAYWGFLLAGVAILVNWVTFQHTLTDVTMGFLAMVAASQIDLIFSDWSDTTNDEVVSAITAVAAGMLCILFCVWLIPDKYGRQLMVTAANPAGFLFALDGKHKVLVTIVHQLVFFVGSALLDVGVVIVTRHTHWVASFACGAVVGTLALALLQNDMHWLELTCFVLASAGLDLGLGAVSVALSPNVYVRVVWGTTTTLWTMMMLTCMGAHMYHLN